VGDIEQDDGSRYLYWTHFYGGDPQRPERVEFCIPGQGSGFYTRYVGDRVGGLLRYDRWADPGTFPHGAYLGKDGRWHASKTPDRNVWLGSDDGEPVTADEARQLAVELGHSPTVLDDTTVVPG
jgi:hypothetical protein